MPPLEMIIIVRNKAMKRKQRKLNGTRIFTATFFFVVTMKANVKTIRYPYRGLIEAMKINFFLFFFRFCANIKNKVDVGKDLRQKKILVDFCCHRRRAKASGSFVSV